MLNNRLQHLLESSNNIDTNQYGYRKGVSSIDALNDIINKIKENKENSLHQQIISLDLKNAFNMAWIHHLKKELKAAKTNETGKICESFLTNRELTCGNKDYLTERGCPQGSSLGPTLWLLIMQGWFRRMKEIREDETINIHTQAFADDQIIIVSGRSVKKIEESWTKAWQKCKEWTKISKAEYNEQKTRIMFITANKKIRGPTIKMEGKAIEQQDYIDYLGIRIDKRLNYIEHIRKSRTKLGEAILNGKNEKALRKR